MFILLFIVANCYQLVQDVFHPQYGYMIIAVEVQQVETLKSPLWNMGRGQKGFIYQYGVSIYMNTHFVHIVYVYIYIMLICNYNYLCSECIITFIIYIYNQMMASVSHGS
jgi:hypothetical protein